VITDTGTHSLDEVSLDGVRASLSEWRLGVVRVRLPRETIEKGVKVKGAHPFLNIHFIVSNLGFPFSSLQHTLSRTLYCWIRCGLCSSVRSTPRALHTSIHVFISPTQQPKC
jgi:hypothetical protein